MSEMKIIVLLFGLLLASTNAIADLSISATDASVRAPIPGMKNTVGYLKLTNNGISDVVLVSAQSNASKVLEFHNHEMTDGVMRMYQQKEVKIPVGETVVFQSGGLHLMFLDVEPSLKGTNSVDVTFGTKSGDEFTIPFNVESIKVKHHHH